MTNEKLCCSWIDMITSKYNNYEMINGCHKRNKNLSYINNILISYSTKIAIFTNGVFLLTKTKYSRTTSRHMSTLRRNVMRLVDNDMRYKILDVECAENIFECYNKNMIIDKTLNIKYLYDEYEHEWDIHKENIDEIGYRF